MSVTHPEFEYTIVLQDDVWDGVVLTYHYFSGEWDSWVFRNDNTNRTLVIKNHRLQYFDLSPVATDDPDLLGVEP